MYVRVDHKEGCVCMLTCVWLFVTQWTVACQAPLSMECSRQEYCRGLPFPTPRDLSDPGIQPHLLCFLHWQVDSLPLVPPGKPKEGFRQKNWCFLTVGLKILESPLDCKEIEPVHPKGNQLWIFIGRTDAKTEAPILWPSDANSQLTGKDRYWER